MTLFGEITTSFFVIFTMLVFVVNFTLVIRSFYIHKQDEVQREFEPGQAPKVSILVPAYNEEVNIVESVKSMLRQDYENFDVIIINDGSSDETAELVRSKFRLQKASQEKHRTSFVNNHQDVIEIYKNKNVMLIDKANGGKGDALNAGFAFSDAEWFVGVDGDTLLEPHAISTYMAKRKDGVEAMASMIGIMNDNEVVDGRVVDPKVPEGFWTRVQWMEYNRSYCLMRHSMKDQDIVTVIPGCCSLLSRNMIEKTGGYKHNHLGEDMEITLNAHAQGGKTQFLSEILSWTEAPDNLRDLGKQRVRWFRGALQSFSQHTGLLFRRDKKALGWFMMPLVWIVDIFGAWIELLGWILAIYTIVFYSYDYTFFLILWTLIVMCHYTNLVLGLIFMNKNLQKIKNKRSILSVALLEGFTYHYCYVYWILKAHVLEIFNVKRKWNQVDRKGLVK